MSSEDHAESERLLNVPSELINMKEVVKTFQY